MASLPPLVTLRNILRGAARLGEDADQYRGRRWSLSLMTLGATSRQSSKSTPGPDAPIFAAAASERHCDQGRATAGRSSPARPRPAQKAVLGAAVSVGLTSTAPVRQRKRLRNAARPGNRETWLLDSGELEETRIGNYSDQAPTAAAAICAVLAAATFSGAHRAGSLAIRTTIKKPVCSAARNLTSESATVAAEGHGEAALHSCANVAPPIHDRSKPARKPSSIGALAFLNSASAQPSSMLFRQT